MHALERAIEMTSRLVAFDTESAKSNLPLIDFVADYLREHDVPFNDAAKTKGHEGTPVVEADVRKTSGDHQQDGGDLDRHHDQIDARAPFDPKRQNQRRGEGAQRRKQIDAMPRPRSRRPGRPVWQDDPDLRQ